MDLHPLDILIHIINIVILFVLLRTILYKPVSKFLRQRREGIEKQLADVENAKREMESLKLQYTEKLSTAEERANEIIMESERKAAMEKEELLAKATEEAKTITLSALASAEQERKKVMNEVRGEAAGLAADLASKILKREISLSDNQEIVNDFFKEMNKV